MSRGARQSRPGDEGVGAEADRAGGERGDALMVRRRPARASRRRFQFVHLMKRLRSTAERAGDDALFAALTECMASDRACPMARLLAADAAAGTPASAAPRLSATASAGPCPARFDVRAALPFVLRAAQESAFAAQDDRYRAAIAECERLVNGSASDGADERALCPVAGVLPRP